jgi:hypothetical protein
LSLSEILQLKPVPFRYADTDFLLSRPCLLDLVELAPINRENPIRAKVWCLCRHLRNADGTAVFQSEEEAGRCPAALASQAISKIEGLYEEGLD